jgi:hypothetical protein
MQITPSLWHWMCTLSTIECFGGQRSWLQYRLNRRCFSHIHLAANPVTRTRGFSGDRISWQAIALYIAICKAERSRYELSLFAQTLWSWVRIPLRVLMFGVYMSLFCVCAVLCLGRGLVTSWSLVRGVLPIVNRSEDWRRGQGPQAL